MKILNFTLAIMRTNGQTFHRAENGATGAYANVADKLVKINSSDLTF